MFTQQNRLLLFDLSPEGISGALETFCAEHGRSIVIYRDNLQLDELIADLVREAKKILGITINIVQDKESLFGSVGRVDGIFLFVKAEKELSNLLVRFASVENLFICAPQTSHYYKSRPVLVQSIPKCGTHLVFECLRAFGFNDPDSLDLPSYTADLKNGHFYNLQHMPITYLAKQYYRISPFVDNFCRSPIVFIMRDPRDTALSLAHYLANQKDYHILSALFNPKKRL
jgi:hypothetical protein